MKKALLPVVLAIIGLALSATIALAQTPTPPGSSPATLPQSTSTPAEPIIFVWAFAEGGFAQNWLVGLTYFILGIVGALVTVYLFLGEFLPSMGGKTEYELLKIELEDFKERRGKALTAREKFARGESEPPAERLNAEDKLTDDYDKVIERLEKQLAQERWRLFLLGFPMYILLGGFFAAAFATNLIQAILIGFGWTAVADRIGLEREVNIKKTLKDTEIKKLEEEAQQAEETARQRIAEMQARMEDQKKTIESLAHAVRGA